MSPIAFPGESAEYRAARNRLLEREVELRRQMEAVAAARRELPPGGPVPEDYVFEGHELQDAVETANLTLEDDVRVSEQDGRSEHVRPFIREELLKPLERWFFGRR